MTDRLQKMAEIRDILKDGDDFSVKEVARAIGCDYDITLDILQGMDHLRQVDEIVDDDGRVTYRLSLPKEPEPPPAPVVPPEDTCLKAPIVRHKTLFARIRNGEEHHRRFM